jgi:hypothetical protein
MLAQLKSGITAGAHFDQTKWSVCLEANNLFVVFHRELDRHLGPSSKFWINRKDCSSAGIPNIPLGALFVIRRKRFGQRVLPWTAEIWRERSGPISAMLAVRWQPPTWPRTKPNS